MDHRAIVSSRWALVMFYFERDEPDWAAKIHVAVAPAHYHNYVLGHLIAAQLRRHLEERVVGGPFFMSEVAGRYLLEAFFGPGARENWRGTVPPDDRGIAERRPFREPRLLKPGSRQHRWPPWVIVAVMELESG